MNNIVNYNIEELYEQNKNMINDIIWKKYAYRANNDYDDMYQIGSEALLEALKTYDSSKGKLTTYIYNAVSNRLKHLDVFVDNVDSSMVNKNVKIKNYILSNKDMTVKELYDNIDFKCSESEFINVYKNVYIVSFEEAEEEFKNMVDETTNVELELESKESEDLLLKQIHKAIKKCDITYQEIYMKWLNSKANGKTLTYKDIGEMYGTSKQRVEQIVKMLNKKVIKLITK